MLTTMLGHNVPGNLDSYLTKPHNTTSSHNTALQKIRLCKLPDENCGPPTR